MIPGRGRIIRNNKLMMAAAAQAELPEVTELTDLTEVIGLPERPNQAEPTISTDVLSATQPITLPITAPATSPARAKQTGTEYARIVRRERLEAIGSAADILALAREQAAQLTRDAQLEAEQIRSEAEQQGLAQGATKLAASALRIEQQRAGLREASQSDMITIARLLAERLIHKALQLNPETIVDLARDAMAQLSRSRRVTLHAHPDDTQALRTHVDVFGIPQECIKILPDPTRARGCLRFDSDIGEIDADIGLQLDRLVEAIRQEFGVSVST